MNDSVTQVPRRSNCLFRKATKILKNSRLFSDPRGGSSPLLGTIAVFESALILRRLSTDFLSLFQRRFRDVVLACALHTLRFFHFFATQLPRGWLS